MTRARGVARTIALIAAIAAVCLIAAFSNWGIQTATGYHHPNPSPTVRSTP